MATWTLPMLNIYYHLKGKPSLQTTQAATLYLDTLHLRLQFSSIQIYPVPIPSLTLPIFRCIFQSRTIWVWPNHNPEHVKHLEEGVWHQLPNYLRFWLVTLRIWEKVMKYAPGSNAYNLFIERKDCRCSSCYWNKSSAPIKKTWWLVSWLKKKCIAT